MPIEYFAELGTTNWFFFARNNYITLLKSLLGLVWTVTDTFFYSFVWLLTY